MGELLFRILFRLSRKFGIEKLKSFLLEYAKGRFDYLFNPPEIPDITDFPETSLSINKENTDVENGNSINKVVKEVTISVGGGVFLLTQLGKNISKSEVENASRDLDSADEDWNDDLLPAFAAIGTGVKSVINDIKIPDIKIPNFDLETLPPYDSLFPDQTDGIRKKFGGGKTVRIKDNEPKNVTIRKNIANGIEGVNNWMSTNISRNIQSDKFKIVTRNGQTVIKRYGREWRTSKAQVGESFDKLFEYEEYLYNKEQQTIGANDAFFGTESGRMRKIEKIILHCTADPEGVDHTLEYYNTEHLKRGKEWKGVGYHFIIHPDGTIETARPINMVGSHCKGQNANSIGIAYVGGMNREYNTAKDTRTRAQKKQMWRLVLYLLQSFPSATVHGHHEYDPKPCPCFDVKSEFDILRNNGFDIDGMFDGYAEISSVTESSSQYNDGLKTQRIDIPIKTNNNG